MNQSQSDFLDKVVYGTPTDSDKPFLVKSEFDEVLTSLYIKPFPASGSEATKDEIRELIALQQDAAQMDPKISGRYLRYDQDIIGSLKIIIAKHIPDESISGLIDQIVQDCLPIITKLKYKFQRPRPNQIAQYLKAALFPLKSVSALSPSYPSASVFYTQAICEVIGSKYPDKHELLEELTFDVATSRLYHGLNYATDNEFAIYAAKQLCKLKAFTTKYGI